MKRKKSIDDIRDQENRITEMARINPTERNTQRAMRAADTADRYVDNIAKTKTGQATNRAGMTLTESPRFDQRAFDTYRRGTERKYAQNTYTGRARTNG